MSPLELVGAVLGVINVFLILQRSIWNYAFGLPMVVVYAFVFYGAQLYSDALLQIYFLVVQFYGLAAWLAHQDAEGRVMVDVMSWKGRATTMVAVVAVSIAVGSLMAFFTDAAVPYLDASIAGGSFW